MTGDLVAVLDATMRIVDTYVRPLRAHIVDGKCDQCAGALLFGPDAQKGMCTRGSALAREMVEEYGRLLAPPDARDVAHVCDKCGAELPSAGADCPEQCARPMPDAPPAPPLPSAPAAPAKPDTADTAASVPAPVSPYKRGLE